MARSSYPTWLSLDRYAKILGLTPANFNQVVDSSVFVGSNGGCDDVWYQYPWQHDDKISREDLGQAIQEAEQDLMRIVGYPLAPTWISEEIIEYPRHYMPEAYSNGYNVRAQYKALKTKWHKVIGSGRRNVTLIGSVNVVYTDADSDGLYETATVSVPTVATHVNKVKVYFSGYNGDPTWEIRPARTKVISGGMFTATFWTWQLCEPDLWEELGVAAPIDITASGAPLQPANVVTSVSVYYETNDFSQVQARFYWEPQPGCGSCGGVGCAQCCATTQDGCIHVRDSETGFIVPAFASYDSDNASWVSVEPSMCREPDYVKVWYYAGDIDNRYLSGYTNDPLSDFWAKMIAMVATARLERPICGCGCTNALSLVERWQTDTAMTTQSRSYIMSWEASIMNNPLGTRIGEMEAWKRIMGTVDVSLGGAAL